MLDCSFFVARLLYRNLTPAVTRRRPTAPFRFKQNPHEGGGHVHGLS